MTSEERPRLALNTFGIAFGSAGLAGTWTVAAATLSAPAPVGHGLWLVAGVVWVVTIVAYLARRGGLGGLRADLRNPVLGPFGALVPTVGSLLAAQLEPSSPATAEVAVLVLLVPTTAFGAWFLASLLTGPRDLLALHGGYLLPTVASALLAAQSLAVIGHPQLALGYFAAGLVFWLFVGSVLLYRFVAGPAIPKPLVPTLAILSAPPAVAGNAWWTITGGRPSPVHLLLLGAMVALLIPQLFLVRRYLSAGFALGFWATTFTAAASATYAVRLLSATPSAEHTWLSWAAVAVATALVGSIAVRSVGLLLTGTRERRRQSRGRFRRISLAGVVTASVAVAFGAGAGSPLLAHDQAVWAFPDWQLTTAFAVYAFALLATLLVAGSVSDYVGRRPVLVGALALMLVASALFVLADHVGWVIAARIVQGVATGAATSTFTAAIIELSSERHRRLMIVMTSAAPVGGLALGAFGAGVVTQYTRNPTEVVFLGLSAVLLLGVAAVLAAGETAQQHAGALGSLRPTLVVPPAARRWFARLTPLVCAGWMFSGLFLGLAPKLDMQIFGLAVGVTSAAVVALQPASAAIAAVAFARTTATRAVHVGAVLVLVGAGCAGCGLLTTNVVVLGAAAVVGGLGQGAAFGATLRILGPLADNAERAGLFSGVYLVAYAGYGLPVLLAGVFTSRFGIGPVAVAYTTVVAVLALAAITTLALQSWREHLVPGATQRTATRIRKGTP